jgi:hypothetical protein
VSYPPEQVIADMIIRIRAEERNSERERIIKILSDPEWHEESKNYTQTDNDLSHDSDYCWGCQLISIFRKGNE